MYALHVNYPRTADSKFDTDYYLNKHLPLCAQALEGHGYKGYVVHGVTGSAPGGDDKSWGGVSLLFESLDALQGALAEAGPVMGADVPNYTDVTPTMSFSEVNVSLG